MKSIILSLIAVFMFINGFSQTPEDAEITGQLRKIITAAGTNYKSIQIGTGSLSGNDTVYNSSI